MLHYTTSETNIDCIESRMLHVNPAEHEVIYKCGSYRVIWFAKQSETWAGVSQLNV